MKLHSGHTEAERTVAELWGDQEQSVATIARAAGVRMESVRAIAKRLGLRPRGRRPEIEAAQIKLAIRPAHVRGEWASPEWWESQRWPYLEALRKQHPNGCRW